MKCDCGEFTNQTIKRIKSIQEKIKSCYINKNCSEWRKAELRDRLNSDKKWLKDLGVKHKQYCLGEFDYKFMGYL